MPVNPFRAMIGQRVELIEHRLRFCACIAARVPDDAITFDGYTVREERAASSFTSHEVGDPFLDAILRREPELGRVAAALAADERGPPEAAQFIRA